MPNFNPGTGGGGGGSAGAITEIQTTAGDGIGTVAFLNSAADVYIAKMTSSDTACTITLPVSGGATDRYVNVLIDAFAAPFVLGPNSVNGTTIPTDSVNHGMDYSLYWNAASNSWLVMGASANSLLASGASILDGGAISTTGFGTIQAVAFVGDGSALTNLTQTFVPGTGAQSAQQGVSAAATGANGSFAQGINVSAGGNYGSFCQGALSVSYGGGSFAQGSTCTAANLGCFAQGETVTASGSYGCFAQGYKVVNTGNTGTFAQGTNCTANGFGGVFAMGANCTASVNGSWAVGFGAVADKRGQSARSQIARVTPGDTQISNMIGIAHTTDATTTAMSTDGGTAKFTIASGHTWAFDIVVSAVRFAGSNVVGAVGDSACFRINGGIKNVGGTVSIVGSLPTTISLGTDTNAAAWTAVAAADNTNKCLLINVTGAATTSIAWVANVHFSECG